MSDFTFTFFSQPSSLWQEVVKLRMRIFVEEMDVPVRLELDDEDQHATHLAVVTAGEIVGTLRLVQQQNAIKIGRVAIASAYRRKGLGTKMMHTVFNWCKQHHISHLQLGSQLYVTRFYSKLGFIKEGEIFMDAGIPHVLMSLQLSEGVSKGYSAAEI